jgi:hypothetical protein
MAKYEASIKELRLKLEPKVTTFAQNLKPTPLAQLSTAASVSQKFIPPAQDKSTLMKTSISQSQLQTHLKASSYLASNRPKPGSALSTHYAQSPSPLIQPKRFDSTVQQPRKSNSIKKKQTKNVENCDLNDEEQVSMSYIIPNTST